MANADLQRRIDDLPFEKMEADEVLARLQADLDRELVVQRNREGELDQLSAEFKVTESALRQELFQAQEELEKDSELEDSELHVSSKRLDAANQLIEGTKAKLDCEKIIFQSDDGLLRELEHALANKAETKK